MRRHVLSAAVLVAIVLPTDAFGIPAFARRYKASCLMCHEPVPKLNAFGDTFAGNGFRMAAGEEPRDTIGTGDPLLALAANLPIALRVDAYVRTSRLSGRTALTSRTLSPITWLLVTM